jgi:3-(3-hydroxy-phenyl)propionate hydroxylase
MAQRYDATPDTVYLLRPDQHVVARWRTLDMAQLQAALARALGGHMGLSSAQAVATA